MLNYRRVWLTLCELEHGPFIYSGFSHWKNGDFPEFFSFLHVYQRVNRFPRVVSRIVLVRASHRVCPKRKNLTISWWIMRCSPPTTLDLEGLLFHFESYFILSSSLYYCIYICIYTHHIYIYTYIYIHIIYIYNIILNSISRDTGRSVKQQWTVEKKIYIIIHIYIYTIYTLYKWYITYIYHRFIENAHISTFWTLAKTLRSPELRGLDLCEPELRRQRRFWGGCSMGKTRDFYGKTVGKLWRMPVWRGIFYVISMGFRFFWDFNGIFYEDLSWFPMIFRNAMAKMSPLRVNAELYGVCLGKHWEHFGISMKQLWCWLTFVVVNPGRCGRITMW